MALQNSGKYNPESHPMYDLTVQSKGTLDDFLRKINRVKGR